MRPYVHWGSKLEGGEGQPNQQLVFILSRGGNLVWLVDNVGSTWCLQPKHYPELGKALPPRAACLYFVPPHQQIVQLRVVSPPSMADPVDSMLDLMRRLPPTRVEENVNSLIRICPDYAEDLLGSVDQPLKVLTDRATGRDYLACDYNRDGDSYR